MPEEKPQGLVTQTPVMTGRTIEIQGKDVMNSPMVSSPSVRKDQIKNQALQTLRGIAGAPAGNLSKFGSSQDKKVIKMEKINEKDEESKTEPAVKVDSKIAKATAQLKKMEI